MKQRLGWLAAAAFAMTTNAAAAQNGVPAQNWPDGWHGGYGHMWSGGYGVLGGLMMLIFWVGIIALVVLAVRYFDGGSGSAARSREAEPLDILRERFAKGEIDEEEFRQRKAALEA